MSTEQILQEYLTTKQLGRKVLYFSELDSTNHYLKEHGSLLEDGTTVFTSYQTSGKGRRGHQWEAERGTILALSFLCKEVEIADMGLLPLLCAVAVCRAVEKICGISTEIKWPNDILANEKKLCGILCESRIYNGIFAVCGIGINLKQTQEDFDRLSLPHAISLHMLRPNLEISPWLLTAEILNAFEPLFLTYKEKGAESFLPEYCRRAVTLGREIRILSENGEKRGRALTINRQGELVCQIDGKEEIVRSGEASVRGLYGYR